MANGRAPKWGASNYAGLAVEFIGPDLETRYSRTGNADVNFFADDDLTALMKARIVTMGWRYRSAGGAFRRAADGTDGRAGWGGERGGRG